MSRHIPYLEYSKMHGYLGAAGSWVEDMDGYYLNKGQQMPENINWKVIAKILVAARVYE